MNRFFHMESPIMVFLNRAADLILVNFLTLLCCLPVVTAGASLTALHYVSLKMVRNEEGYLVRGFFKAFKENLKQAIIIGIFVFVVNGVIVTDFYLLFFGGMEVPTAIKIIMAAAIFLFLCGEIYLFPLLCHFENSVKNIIKNSYLLAILYFPSTICMLTVYGAFFFVEVFFFVKLLPFVFLFGISLPIYINTYIISSVFKKLEPPEEGISQSV